MLSNVIKCDYTQKNPETVSNQSLFLNIYIIKKIVSHTHTHTHTGEKIRYVSWERYFFYVSAVTCRVRSRKTGIAVPFAQLWNTSKGSSKQRGWPCWDRAVAKHLHRRSKRWSRGHKTSPTALIRVTSTEKISSCFAIARNSSSIHSYGSAIVWWVNRILFYFTRKRD